MRTSTIAPGSLDPAPCPPVSTDTLPQSWGWPVRLVDSTVVLETTSGFCGIRLRQHLGVAVLHLLRAAGAEGPVVRAMRPDPWLVFLAEADTVVEAETVQRHNAELLSGGRTIPLPTTYTDSGPLSWAVPPRPNHRWLPALSTVLWALTAATPEVRTPEPALPY